MGKYSVVWMKDMYNFEIINSFSNLIEARKRLNDKKKKYKGNYTIVKFTE